jgi:NhaP-type Na+/H+ or K+/H+ antiporter
LEQVPQERNHWIFVAALTLGIRCTRDHMELSFGNGALLLLLVGAVVAMATRRLKLPYSVGLVVAGMALALLPMAPKISLTKEIIFNLLLPPLIFEAAFYLRWDQLRGNFQ